MPPGAFCRWGCPSRTRIPSWSSQIPPDACDAIVALSDGAKYPRWSDLALRQRIDVAEVSSEGLIRERGPPGKIGAAVDNVGFC